MNQLIMTLLLSWPCVGVVSAPAAHYESDADSERKSRLEVMKKLVGSLEISQTIVTPEKRDETVSLSPELVLTYTDPAREFSDSTMWLWTDKGRPVATTTVEYYPDRPADKTWIFEFATLSTHPVTMRLGKQKAWHIQQPAAIRREIASAPVPADSRPRRLQQMRDIARRFAVETFTPRGDRFVVRLMPTPLLRFPESESDRADGAVFAFAYGTNPEVILLVEAVETADGLEWRYGVAPLTAIGIVVRLDDQEVWTRTFGRGPTIQAVYVNGALAPTDITEKQAEK
jgi:hypothetical protein